MFRTERRYWIERLEVQEENRDIEAGIEQMSTGVEILLKMSDETSTGAHDVGSNRVDRNEQQLIRDSRINPLSPLEMRRK